MVWRLANYSEKLFLNISWCLNKRSYLNTCTNNSHQGEKPFKLHMSSLYEQTCTHWYWLFCPRKIHRKCPWRLQTISLCWHGLVWVFMETERLTRDQGQDEISWPFHFPSLQLELTATWQVELCGELKANRSCRRAERLDDWETVKRRKPQERCLFIDGGPQRNTWTWPGIIVMHVEIKNVMNVYPVKTSPHLFQLFRRMMRCCLPVRVDIIFCGLQNVIRLSAGM